MRKILVSILLTAGAAASSDAHAGTRIDQYHRRDGKVETYYAGGDPILASSIALLHQFWNQYRVGTAWPNVRGELDLYIPDELRALGHLGADSVMRDIALEVRTGIAQDGGLLRSPVGSLVRLRAPRHVSDVLRWLPGDATLAAAARTHVYAQQVAFGGGIPGLHPYLDPATLQPVASDPADYCTVEGSQLGELTFDLANAGFAFQGMAEIAALTGDHHLLAWVDDKLAFLIENKTVPTSNLLPVDYTQYGACDTGTPESDNLYFSRYALHGVRAIDRASVTFQNAAANTRDQLADMALANIDDWFRFAWDDSSEMFLNRVPYDGPVTDFVLSGDGKWNPLYAGAVAYDFTRDAFYLQRARQHWETLRDNALTTIVDCTYNAGAGTGDGIEPDLPLLAQALAELHAVMSPTTQVGGVPYGYFATEARNLAAQIFQRAGATTCPSYSTTPPRPLLSNTIERDSYAMVKVALLTARVGRLEIDTGAPGGRVRVYRCTIQGCTDTVNARLPSNSQVAVALIPDGVTYNVTVGGTTKQVALNGSARVVF